jgi:hypothetical protein
MLVLVYIVVMLQTNGLALSWLSITPNSVFRDFYFRCKILNPNIPHWWEVQNEEHIMKNNRTIQFFMSFEFCFTSLWPRQVC